MSTDTSVIIAILAACIVVVLLGCLFFAIMITICMLKDAIENAILTYTTLCNIINEEKHNITCSNDLDKIKYREVDYDDGK